MTQLTRVGEDADFFNNPQPTGGAGAGASSGLDAFPDFGEAADFK